MTLALSESSAALPRTGRWLNHDITRCCDGLGATFNSLRASLFYVLVYNLTFVHYPLCATHGANATAIDEWLGMGDADPSCGSRCVTRAIAAGTLRKVSYMVRGRQTLESVLKSGCGGVDADEYELEGDAEDALLICTDVCDANGKSLGGIRLSSKLVP